MLPYSKRAPMPGDQHRLAVDEARFFELCMCLFRVHQIGLHEFDGFGPAFAAQLFGRQPELLAKRPRECFVGAVPRLERDRQDVGRAVGELPRGFGQPPCADIAHDGLVQRIAEGPRHVEPRYAGSRGDIVEGYVLAEVAFDIPERFHHGVQHGFSQEAGLFYAPISPAGLIEIALRETFRIALGCLEFSCFVLICAKLAIRFESTGFAG